MSEEEKEVRYQELWTMYEDPTKNPDLPSQFHMIENQGKAFGVYLKDPKSDPIDLKDEDGNLVDFSGKIEFTN